MWLSTWHQHGAPENAPKHISGHKQQIEYFFDKNNIKWMNLPTQRLYDDGEKCNLNDLDCNWCAHVLRFVCLFGDASDQRQERNFLPRVVRPLGTLAPSASWMASIWRKPLAYPHYHQSSYYL